MPTRPLLPLLLVTALALPHTARAQTFESVGIRAQGMGGAFVAVADDATATWWNPAGLAGGAYFGGVIEYGRRDPDDPAFDGVSHRAFALAYPALGLSYYRLSVSQIRPPVSTATDATGRQDQGTAGTGSSRVDISQFGATAGQSLGNHLVLASTLKLVHAAGDTAADLDVGAMVKFGLARVGLTVRNLREPTLGTGSDVVTLSRMARVGLALVGPSHGPVDALALAVDADLTTDSTPTGDARRVAGGVEAWLAKRRVGLRGGLSTSTIGASRTRTSGGVSLALRRGVYAEGQATNESGSQATWGVDLRVTF